MNKSNAGAVASTEVLGAGGERLSERELVALMGKCTSTQVLHCDFGPGVVRLRPGECNRWAREAMATMRAAPNAEHQRPRSGPLHGPVGPQSEGD